jgi:hypothetical protein
MQRSGKKRVENTKSTPRALVLGCQASMLGTTRR